MNALLCTLLALAITSGAFAEATVNIKSDLSEVVISIGEKQLADLPMKDGLATWMGNLDSARTDTSALFLGFATYEAVAKLAAEGVPFIRQKSDGGVIPANAGGGIYQITVTKGKGEVIPVSFSPFGIGVHAPDGSVWHSGFFSISTNPEDWQPYK